MKKRKKILLASLLLLLIIFLGIITIALASPGGIMAGLSAGDNLDEAAAYPGDQSSDTQDNGDTTLSDDSNNPLPSQPVATSVPLYTVTYNAGAYGTLTPENLGQTTESVTGGQTSSSVPDVNTAAGYAFAGWYRDSQMTLLSSAEAAGLAINADTTFTAQYTQIPYMVAFDLAGHGTTGNRLIYDNVYYGDTITIPAVTADFGWRFIGWDVEPRTKVTGSANYNAQYMQLPASLAPSTATYTVTFDLVGHGTSPDTLVFDPVNSGDTITVPAVTADAGWTFDGWDVAPSTTVAGSANYTAQYTHIPYNVTFDLGSYGTSPDTLVFDPVYYGDTITVPAVTANSGWRFTGWDTVPDTTVTGDAVYTAQYRIDRFK